MDEQYDCRSAIKYVLGTGNPWRLGVLSIIECSNEPARNVSYIEKATEEVCSPNIDLVGIGVVVAFIAGSTLCALCAIALAALDSILDRNRIFPGFIQKRISSKCIELDTRNCEIWRRTLERTLLSLGDQQLVTGLSLGVAFFIGFFKATDELWPQSVILPEGLLAVYIGALSSSSHLACLTTLRGYFAEHQGTFYIRIVLIVLYNAMFIGGIFQAQAFIAPLLASLFGPRFLAIPTDSPASVAPCLLVILPVLYLFYTSLLQNMPKVKRRVESGIMYILEAASRCWGWFHQKASQVSELCMRRFKAEKPSTEPEKFTSASSISPDSNQTLRRIRTAASHAAWSLVLGSPGYNFLLQQASFAIALVFTIAQKWVSRPGPPQLVPAENSDSNGTFVWNSYCVLYGESVENVIDFGQLLPIVLLFLPVLTLVETLFEARKEVPKRQSNGGHEKLKFEPLALDTDQNSVSRDVTKGHGGTVSAVRQRSLEEQLPSVPEVVQKK